jgi:hypothetical protein
VRTERRPELRPGRIDGWTIAGQVLLAAGFVGMVLGIYEVGGLLALGLGFATIWAGLVVTFMGEARRRAREDDAFRWVVSDEPGD